MRRRFGADLKLIAGAALAAGRNNGGFDIIERSPCPMVSQTSALRAWRHRAFLLADSALSSSCSQGAAPGVAGVTTSYGGAAVCTPAEVRPAGSGNCCFAGLAWSRRLPGEQMSGWQADIRAMHQRDFTAQQPWSGLPANVPRAGSAAADGQRTEQATSWRWRRW